VLARAAPEPAPQVECRDRILGGHVGLNTKNNEVTCECRPRSAAASVLTCSRRHQEIRPAGPLPGRAGAVQLQQHDVRALELLSCPHSPLTPRPYAGFVLESTTGLSSASRSNALSIRHAVDFEVAAVETRVEVAGEVKLPGTKYNAATNTVGLMVRHRAGCAGLAARTCAEWHFCRPANAGSSSWAHALACRGPSTSGCTR
jgi:hypothetical protein